MRALPLLCLLAFFAFNHAVTANWRHSEGKLFRVSKVGQEGVEENQEKLLEIYEAIRSQYIKTDDGRVLPFDQLETEGYKIFDVTGAYHLGGNHYWLEESDIIIETKGTEIQGKSVRMITMQDGFYNAVNTNPPRKMKKFVVKQFNPKNFLTHEEFVFILQEGGIFIVELRGLSECQKCVGSGYTTTPNGRSYDCPNCHEPNSGQAWKMIQYRVVWDLKE